MFLCFSQLSFADAAAEVLLPNVSKATVALDEKRRVVVQKILEKYPDKFSSHVKESILSQLVELGMTPYEAHLAAGAFFFKVEADKEKWPGNPDPYRVMWAQSERPDNSKIWMTFETPTQFPDEGKRRFRVAFEKGRAVVIAKLEK